MRNLPFSPKVTVVLVAGIVILLTVITVDLVKKARVNSDAGDSASEKQSLNVEALGTPGISLKRNTAANGVDSDGDGLYDWEEELRRTDPNNPDTDGDGTNDKDEINQQRDPLVAGPDDSLVSSTGPIANIDYTPGTLSAQLGEVFMENYLKMGSGANFNQETFEEFSARVADESVTLARIQNTYTTTDFRTFSDVDTAGVRVYANTFALAMLDFYSVLEQAKKLPASQQVDIIERIFTSHAKQLTSFRVPRGILDSHMGYTNNIAKTAEILRRIINTERDPVKALYALREYEEIQSARSQYLYNVSEYFRLNDILFDDTEVGIFWQKL